MFWPMTASWSETSFRSTSKILVIEFHLPQSALPCIDSEIGESNGVIQQIRSHSQSISIFPSINTALV